MSSTELSIEVIADIKQIISSLNTLNQRFERFAGDIAKSTGKAAERINSWSGGLIKLGLSIQSGVFLVRGMIGAIQKLTAASNAQEQAEAALSQAMRNTGQYSESAIANLKNYAAELQKATIYGDEETLQAAAMLQAMTGLNQEGLKPLIKATMDFATAQRMDLASAADLVGKAIASDVNSLARYGIEVEGAAGSTKRLEMAVGGIERRFRGAAEQAGSTNTAKMIQMTNAIGDAIENLSLLAKKVLAPVAEKIGAIARTWGDFIQRLGESKLETAVRQLREMGIEAERLAGLEFMVNIERATDALLNNDKKIKNILTSTTNHLSRDTLEALGVTVKFSQKQRAGLHGEMYEYGEFTYNLQNLNKVTAENINAQIEKTKQKVAELIKGRDNLTDDQKQQVQLYSQEIEALGQLLRLTLDRERAEELIRRKGRPKEQTDQAAQIKYITEDEQKLQDQINKILIDRLPLNERIVKLTEELGKIDQSTLQGKLKYLQTEDELLKVKEQAADLDRRLVESTARLARAEMEKQPREERAYLDKIRQLDQEYAAAKEGTDKKKELFIQLQNAEAEYLEWRRDQIRQNEEEITDIITGGGFGAAYETVIERLRQKLIAWAITEIKLAMWVEKTKSAIKEAWLGRTMALEELFALKSIKLNLKQAASNFIAGITNLFRSVMGIPFPGNLLAFAAGGAAVIGLLNSLKAKGQSIVKAAEGAIINKPTLALVGEAVSRSGPELILPSRTFKRYMDTEVMPEFKAKLDAAVVAKIDNSGIHERLERVEKAVRESARETARQLAKYRRGQL